MDALFFNFTEFPVSNQNAVFISIKVTKSLLVLSSCSKSVCFAQLLQCTTMRDQ